MRNFDKIRTKMGNNLVVKKVTVNTPTSEYLCL